MFEYVESRDFTLIILDEILKGTNSQDKLNGSMLVLEELSKHPVSGIVATHDLGITRLEEKHPGMFRNYCFEIELSDEMRYSYKIGRDIAEQSACEMRKRVSMLVFIDVMCLYKWGHVVAALR